MKNGEEEQEQEEEEEEEECRVVFGAARTCKEKEKGSRIVRRSSSVIHHGRIARLCPCFDGATHSQTNRLCVCASLSSPPSRVVI
jgi:hypothetical protein